MPDRNPTEEIVAKILAMPKYKNVQMPVETIRALIANCGPGSRGPADLEKRVREKLHNIVAPYLGDLDYTDATEAFARIKGDPGAVREFSARALTAHASTRERGPELERLYQSLFEEMGMAGKICGVADLACGLHPLGLPFMNLPSGCAYYAYDLHMARVHFLDTFIREQGYAGGCFHRDILLSPPAEKFGVAFFFKEAHRFEKREPGALLRLIDRLDASRIVVSLPIQSLGTRSQISPKYESMLREYAKANSLLLKSMVFGNEIFYVIFTENTP